MTPKETRMSLMRERDPTSIVVRTVASSASPYTLGEAVLTVSGRGGCEAGRAISGAILSICSARDWDGKDYLRIIPRVVLVEDPRLT